MIFVFATDDCSLASFRTEAEAIAYAECIDVENDVYRFFADNGAELLPRIIRSENRGCFALLTGAYVVVASSDTSPVLSGLISQIRSYEGVIKSQAELLATLEGPGL